MNCASATLPVTATITTFFLRWKPKPRAAFCAKRLCATLVTSPCMEAPGSCRLQDRLPNVSNIRDLAEALPSLQPGKIVRSSAPVHATPEEVELLRDKLALHTLIDLRAAEEIREQDGDALMFKGSAYINYTRNFLAGQVQGQVQVPGALDVVRHHITLLERSRYYPALIFRMPISTTLYAAACATFDRDKARGAMLKKVNEGGLDLLYQILLDTSQAEFRATLQIVLDSAECGRNTLFFCKAGKDRTGLVAALLLILLGASREQVVEDYARSGEFPALALAGMEKKVELNGLDRARFEAAPPETMENTLEYIDMKYGGVPQYADSIGFSYRDQQRLRKALLGRRAPPTPPPPLPKQLSLIEQQDLERRELAAERLLSVLSGLSDVTEIEIIEKAEIMKVDLERSSTSELL